MCNSAEDMPADPQPPPREIIEPDEVLPPEWDHVYWLTDIFRSYEDQERAS